MIQNTSQNGNVELDEIGDGTTGLTEAVGTFQTEPFTQIQNCRSQKDENGKEHLTPYSMPFILKLINDATDNSFGFAVGGLFAPAKNSVDWFKNASGLTGYLGSVTRRPCIFRRNAGCHTSSEVFEELKRTAPKYDSIDHFPHEPPMPGHFYCCETVEPGDGKTLYELVDRFCPETEIDRDLILLYFVTAIWGGGGGTRPAFLVTSDDGRGVGKTTLCESVGQVVGECLSLSANENEEEIKKRLLSEEGQSKRCVHLDNVKTLKFSWAALEAFITARNISGRRMYFGEASRENSILWSITLNGASLSKDVAQRVVIIKLKKPQRSGSWKEDTQEFIEVNRQKLIADCIGFIRGPKYQLSQFSRWASWEKDVLKLLPNCDEIQQVILERQQGADVEDEEYGIITEYFSGRLQQCSYDTDRDQIFIPSKIVTQWFNLATNEHEKSVSVSSRLNQAINEGGLKRLRKNKCNAWGRGFIWQGPLTDFECKIYTDIETRLDNSRNQF